MTHTEAEKVLDACPDVEWRLLFGLSRYGGLHFPSESFDLRWEDTVWVRSRMTVRSPKTEHHEDGASRVVPIFPERLPHLWDAFEATEARAEYVITRYRDTRQNLRTQLSRIIKRAGLTPWPKLWQNLRATREAELVESFPTHVACARIGNSQAVAAKHYPQTTDERYAWAVNGEGAALQNAVQHPRASDCTAGNDSSAEPDKQGVFVGMRNDAESLNAGELETLGQTGLEPVLSGF